jgi:uncharacterized protein involved in exopolysaccharide biosynthesis
MTDLVERLRSFHHTNSVYGAAQDAADRIEALEARIEALEAARRIDLQQCAAQLDQNTATMDVARARIEALEAELERSRSLLTLVLHTEANRAALDKDAGR